MSEPFIAEVRIVGFNFPPRGWAFCDGQLLPIAQNTALFSLVGTTFGGDGRTNFGLPRLQGRAPMHPGTGPGLSTRRWGELGGAETNTLTEATMASHSHAIVGTNATAQQSTPTNNLLARSPDNDAYGTPGTIVNMANPMTTETGGNAAHNNMQPFLAMYFCIALVGTYPSRN